MTADEWVGWVGAVLCVAWVIAPRLRAYDRRREAARRERDWQKYVALTVKRDKDEYWAGIEKATGVDPFPIPAIGPGQAEHIFRCQLEDDEALAEFLREAS